ncbi:hypothetical protein Peur_065507 [Populus x canadensis]
MVRVHGVKEDLGLESIAGEDESCLLLISTHRRNAFSDLKETAPLGPIQPLRTSSKYDKIVATSTANSLNSVGQQTFSPQHNSGPNINFFQALKETFISLPPLVDGGVTVGVVYKYIKKKKAFILYWK